MLVAAALLVVCCGSTTPDAPARRELASRLEQARGLYEVAAESGPWIECGNLGEGLEAVLRLEEGEVHACIELVEDLSTQAPVRFAGCMALACAKAGVDSGIAVRLLTIALRADPENDIIIKAARWALAKHGDLAASTVMMYSRGKPTIEDRARLSILLRESGVRTENVHGLLKQWSASRDVDGLWARWALAGLGGGCAGFARSILEGLESDSPALRGDAYSVLTAMKGINCVLEIVRELCGELESGRLSAFASRVVREEVDRWGGCGGLTDQGNR